MRYLSIFSLLLLAPFFACEKSDNEGPADLFTGHQIEGKWTLVQSKVMLKFSDGSVQNATVAGSPDKYLDLKHTKTINHTAEGTFTSSGFGTISNGKWTLDQANATLDLIYNETPALYQYRRVDEVSEHKLVMSADDNMVKLIYEVNDLNDGSGKTVTGGSIFDEYSR